jgi:hypothetical protein
VIGRRIAVRINHIVCLPEPVLLELGEHGGEVAFRGGNFEPGSPDVEPRYGVFRFRAPKDALGLGHFEDRG